MNVKLISFTVAFALLVAAVAFAVRCNSAVHTMANADKDGPYTVVIDAGHGGEDSGAVGIQGILEKDINLGICETLEAIFGLYGINTKMTRYEDVSLHTKGAELKKQRKLSDAQNRIKLIKETSNATLISIHQNSFPQEEIRGTQVFFAKSNVRSRALAEHIHDAIKTGIPESSRREIKQAEDRVYLLKNVSCPAILIECGFLSNAADTELLMSDRYRQKISACIVSGYINYLNDD